MTRLDERRGMFPLVNGPGDCLARLRDVPESVSRVKRVKRWTTRTLTPGARVLNRTILDRHYRRLSTSLRPLPIPAFTGPLLLVFPHVDDEVIAVGGLLGAWREQGIEVDLVYTTDSSAGGVGATPEVRGATRLAEAVEVQRQTGIRSLTVLSGVNDELAAMSDRVTGELAQIVASGGYEAVFAVGPVDAHPEHRLSATLIASALQRAGFEGPVFVGENSSLLPAGLVTHAFGLTHAALRARDQLFTIFASQTTMGFEVYHDLARSKRHLVPGSDAAELFHQTDARALEALSRRVSLGLFEEVLRHRIGNSWSLWRVLASLGSRAGR